MRKKGIGWGTFISLIFGVIVVSVIIFAIAFPGQLASKTRDAAFSFGLGELPSERPPEFAGKSSVPQAIRSYFDNLVNRIEKGIEDENQDPCLIDIGEMPDLGNFNIILSPDNAKIEKLKLESFSPTDYNEDIENFNNPCIIKDDAAVAFDQCYFRDSPTYCGTILNKVASGQAIALEDGKYSRYLYKSVKGSEQYFCFIKLYNDVNYLSLTWSPCDSPRNNGADGIDNDCKDEIKEIAEC